MRHAHASYAKVTLEIQVSHLHICISDNGQGIRPELKRKDSFGLEIMQERAERIGGAAHLPGAATRDLRRFKIAVGFGGLIHAIYSGQYC